VKIAFVTDIHLAEDPGNPGSLYPMQSNGLSQIVAGITMAEPDLILIGGDNSGGIPPYKATPAERNAHVHFRLALARVAPIVEVQGNHDYPGDYDVFNALRSAHEITYATEPCIVEIEDVCNVACLPWVFASDAMVAGVEHRSFVVSEAKHLAQAALEANKRNGLPCVILAHAAISGTLIREGQPSVPVKDPVLSPEELVVRRPSGAIYKAGFFGHYHHRQAVKYADGTVAGIYGGSVFIHEYGESTDKGWTLYDSHGAACRYGTKTIDQPAKVKVVYDPATGEIVDVKPELSPLDGMTLEDMKALDLSEYDIRLEIRVPPEGAAFYKREIAEARTALGKTAMSLDVKLKAKPKTLAREGAAKLAAITSYEKKVDHYLRAHSQLAPTKKEIKTAVNLFSEIVSEVDGVA
jgi:DNA repair exonuclease SbcCD nuclease subunit